MKTLKKIFNVVNLVAIVGITYTLIRLILDAMNVVEIYGLDSDIVGWIMLISWGMDVVSNIALRVIRRIKKSKKSKK